MSSHHQSKPTVDDASTASDDGSSSKGSKGSNHHLGAAVSGAMQKLSSPIGDRLRKVARKSDHHDSTHSSRSVTPTPPISEKRKTYNGGEDANLYGTVEQTSGTLATPIKDVADFFGEGGKAVKRLVHRGKHNHTSRSVPQGEADDGEDSHLAAVPPDETLEKMGVIINKRLKGVSIPNYYEAAWSEDSEGTDTEPLYRSFLEESGKENIIVGEWAKADSGSGFVGDWDGEEYTQKRTVTFVFDKKIPMQSKPVIAQVKQTHYCRVEGDDKCVVAMTIEMKNVPFSDCFNVEIRWVATRSGKNDVVVQVGLFVNFIKSTMLAGKIRSGTTQQTTLQQMQLFDKVQQACGATVEEAAVVAPSVPPKEATKLTRDEAGRILVLSGCLLLLTSQAECIFMHKSHAAAQVVEVLSCGVTSLLAGLILLVPHVCQLLDNECLFVVIAHLVSGLFISVSSGMGIVSHSGGSTVLLMAAWAVLAWGVWRQGTESKTT